MINLALDTLYKCFLGLVVVITFATTQLYAQPPSSIDLLPAYINDEWKAIGSTQVISKRQASDFPDSELYAEYGLRQITKRVYSNSKVSYLVEVFNMETPAGAYGLFTFSQITNKLSQREFYGGTYLVRVSGLNKSPLLDESIVAAVKRRFPSKSDELPILPSKLPSADKINGSEKYVIGPIGLGKLPTLGELKNLIKFRGGAEVVTAEYRNGDGKMSLTLIEYYTPQLASDGYSQIQNHFDQLTQPEKDKTILKRIGNYVVEAINVQDSLSAQTLISQIKYAPKIYWEARKLSDIPLEYRPPDPAIAEEASETANVILRTFYWIGIMIMSALLLGVFFGGATFYWNRRRRRLLGIDDMFADAGGTVRLNLDNCLITTNNQIEVKDKVLTQKPKAE